MRKFSLLFLLAMCSAAVWAQSDSSDRPRVYVEPSESWEVHGSGGAGAHGGGYSESGGARPQTAEIIKNINERCPNISVNMHRNLADYVVQLDHEGGKALQHSNKVVVFERVSGDSIMSKSTFSLGGAVQAACDQILFRWNSDRDRLLNARSVDLKSVENPSAPAEQPRASAEPQANVAEVSIVATPAGAEIEVDGEFIGSAPSTISLKTGTHAVVARKKGYAMWSRTLRVTAGKVTISIEMDEQK